jgi:hypothetical protein
MEPEQLRQFVERISSSRLGGTQNHSSEDTAMNEDRIAVPPGTWAAKCKKVLAASRVTRKAKPMGSSTRRQGRPRISMDSDAAQVVRQGAIDTEDYVRRIIEQRPYTTAFAALCVGWFIGRMRRRDRNLPLK